MVRRDERKVVRAAWFTLVLESIMFAVVMVGMFTSAVGLGWTGSTITSLVVVIVVWPLVLGASGFNLHRAYARSGEREVRQAAVESALENALRGALLDEMGVTAEVRRYERVEPGEIRMGDAVHHHGPEAGQDDEPDSWTAGFDGDKGPFESGVWFRRTR